MLKGDVNLPTNLPTFQLFN